MQEFAIRGIRKIPYENPFFPRQALKIFFASHSHQTVDAPYRVWFDLDNSLTRWKRPFLKFFFLRNSKSSVCNTNFFPDTVYQKIFCFTLSLHWWYSIPHLVWFGQLHNPMKKTFFKNSQKIEFREVRQSQCEDTLFSLGKLYQKFFLLYTLITLLILNTEFGLIWTTPWPDEKDLYLKFLFREIQKIPYEILTFFPGKVNQLFLLYTLITLVILHTEFG